MINCEVRVLDCTGGNIIDACMLAAMSALKAFRKPETSVFTNEAILEMQRGEGDTVGLESGVIVHHSDEREPLPLALHHVPLSVTLGVFKNTLLGASSSSSSAAAEEQRVYSTTVRVVLLTW